MIPPADERFTEIYEQHYSSVLAYCGRRLNRAEAEEVANEVFVVLWRRIDQFDHEEPLAWLYSVAYKAVANRYRGEKRKARLSDRLFSLPTGEPIRPEDIVDTPGTRSADRRSNHPTAPDRPTGPATRRLGRTASFWYRQSYRVFTGRRRATPPPRQEAVGQSRVLLLRSCSRWFAFIGSGRTAMNADAAFEILQEANPVPDPDRYRQITAAGHSFLAATKERILHMETLTPAPEKQEPPARRSGLAIAATVFVVVVVLGVSLALTATTTGCCCPGAYHRWHHHPRTTHDGRLDPRTTVQHSDRSGRGISDREIHGRLPRVGAADGG